MKFLPVAYCLPLPVNLDTSELIAVLATLVKLVPIHAPTALVMA